MRPDLVSIIMPVYNMEKYVSESIDSVLSQTYLNWELIVVDDLSKDRSREIITQYSQKDNRIKPLFKTYNSGSADSRNMGIEKSEGRYIAFLDSDDLWDAVFLEKQIHFMNENEAPLVFSSYRIVDEDKQEILKPHIVHHKKLDYHNNLLFNKVGILTAIYDTSKLGKMYFDVSLKSMRDDYALWLDILKVVPFGYGNKEILASYRQRKGSLTSSKSKLFIPHFKFLRNREKLGSIQSLLYTLHFTYYAWKKYFYNRL